jgi:hypothetical protein
MFNSMKGPWVMLAMKLGFAGCGEDDYIAVMVAVIS